MYLMCTVYTLYTFVPFSAVIYSYPVLVFLDNQPHLVVGYLTSQQVSTGN